MNFLKNKKIGFRISFYFVLIITFVLLGVYLINYYFTREIILESTKKNIANLTNYNISRIENILSRVELIPENLTIMSDKDEWSFDYMNSVLEKLVRNNKEIFGGAIAYEQGVLIPRDKYYSPYFYKRNGNVLGIDIATETYLYPYKDWYQIPKYTSRSLWSEPYFDEGGGDITMTTYSVPFYVHKDSQKVFAGVMTADVSLDWLKNIVDSVKIFNEGFAFLISRKGVFLAHPNTKYVMNESVFSLAETMHLPELRKVGRSMIKGETGFEEVYSLLMDGDTFLYYTPMTKSGWTFGIIFSADELYAGLDQLNRIILTIGFFGFIIMLIMIFFVVNTSLKPLVELSKSVAVIGKGELNVEFPTIKFNDEVGILTGSMQLMLDQLKKYIDDLKYTTSENQRIESELNIARQIQMGMIPKTFPPFPKRNDLDIYAVMKPAKEVGGDLYDYFFLDDENLCFAIGDVSGKGVPASLLMAVTRTLLRAKSDENVQVEELINGINMGIKTENTTKLFVTFFLGILNLKTGELIYSNAGHNFPFIIRDNGIEQLDVTHGLPLGVGLSGNYGTAKVELQKGNKIVLFTDGINEAQNGFEEMFDDFRIKKYLAFSKSKNVKETTEGLLNSVNNFVGDCEQYDDMTILTLQLL